MSTAANKRDHSSLPSVDAWENEGGALAPQPAKQTASPRRLSAFRGQDEREPQNSGSNHAGSAAHAQRRQTSPSSGVCLKGNATAVRSRLYIAFAIIEVCEGRTTTINK